MLSSYTVSCMPIELSTHFIVTPTCCVPVFTVACLSWSSSLVCLSGCSPCSSRSPWRWWRWATAAGCRCLGSRYPSRPAKPGVAAATERPQGIARVRTLWRLWRAEKTDPAPFYRMLAAEAVEDLERRYGALAGKTVVDLGCGPGLYTDAFRAAGAHVIPVDNDPAERELAGGPPEGVLVPAAGGLPVGD